MGGVMNDMRMWIVAAVASAALVGWMVTRSPEKDDGDAEDATSTSERTLSAQRSPRKATFEDVVTEILGDNFPVTREELFKGAKVALHEKDKCHVLGSLNWQEVPKLRKLPARFAKNATWIAARTDPPLDLQFWLPHHRRRPQAERERHQGLAGRVFQGHCRW